MGRIVVLDRNMVNMIAAGEVIERPASVVKELMENSIDAGATRITVSIEDGGRKLISLADNGCGMDKADLANAFEPHATSKIKTTADLRQISTLGFRGEALASIASVAQVRAVSRTKDAPGGNCIEIDCGEKNAPAPFSADCGTRIEVRDLFYKLPARRKFLRTPNTETGHITEQFIRTALAQPELDMTLISNGRELYRLVPGRGLRRRIAELFSSEIAENLIETESSEKGLHIRALLGKPAISRTNNRFQYVFLNSRFIRDKFISHAMKEAYRSTLEPNRFPVVFLFIQMPFEDYDVNVHPTKIEVRFYNANLVHSQILGCLREKLLGTDLSVEARLGAVSSPDAASTAGSDERTQRINDAMAEFFRKHRPIQTQRQFSFRDTGPAKTTHKTPQSKIPAPVAEVLPQRKFIQIQDSFIVAATSDGFIIIDQHALHERIMYENMRRRISNGALESQKLLIPESFELSDAKTEMLDANAELIEKLGIELVPFGPGTMAIQAFPTLLNKAEPLDFVCDLVDLLDDVAGQRLEADQLLDKVLSMAACKAAIKAGQRLNDSEIEQLLADREVVEAAACCPHGRPTTIKFSVTDLEKQFRRT